MDELIFASMDRCPSYSSFFGALGCAAAIVFTVFGAYYGTAKSSGAIFASGVLHLERLMQNTLCPIMAQILSIYRLVAAVVIANDLKEKQALHTSFLQLGAGISVELCGLAAGLAIGVVGDVGVRATSQQPRLYVSMVLILIFAEVPGLYGLVIAVLLQSKSTDSVTECKF
ncbi:V-type ATPase [Colletotrichum eremochloae]|nr:V-type ATPase [Colletotrichum eremochloae]